MPGDSLLDNEFKYITPPSGMPHLYTVHLSPATAKLQYHMLFSLGKGTWANTDKESIFDLLGMRLSCHQLVQEIKNSAPFVFHSNKITFFGF